MVKSSTFLGVVINAPLTGPTM